MKQPKYIQSSPSDILTIAEATRRLAMNKQDARRFLEENNLIHSISGRPRVLWGMIIEKIFGVNAYPSISSNQIMGGDDEEFEIEVLD